MHIDDSDVVEVISSNHVSCQEAKSTCCLLHFMCESRIAFLSVAIVSRTSTTATGIRKGDLFSGQSRYNCTEVVLGYNPGAGCFSWTEHGSGACTNLQEMYEVYG